jgi:hypothetical protein
VKSRGIVLAVLLSVVLVTSYVNAVVFWEETFEDPNMPAWAVFNNVRPPVYPVNGVTTNQAFAGSRALQLRYDGDTGGGPWHDRSFTSTPEVWLRYYDRYHNYTQSQGFSTKLMYVGGARPDFWINYNSPGGTNMTLELGGQIVAEPCASTGHPAYDSCNYYANFDNTPHPLDRWVCWEVHIKMNTPGVANGVAEVYWTDTTIGTRVKKMAHTAQVFRGPSVTNPPGCTGDCNSSTAQFSYLRIYRQNGNGDRYIDNLAVGDGPTSPGCGGAAPPVVTAPSNLSVTTP